MTIVPAPPVALSRRRARRRAGCMHHSWARTGRCRVAPDVEPPSQRRYEPWDLACGGERLLARCFGAATSAGTAASSSAAPRATACGAAAARTSASTSATGTRRARTGSMSSAADAVASGQEAVLGEHFLRVHELGWRVALLELQPGQRLDERAQRARRLQPRLGVHDAYLDGAEPGLWARVPPQERRLGDRARAQEQVDGGDPVGVVRRSAAAGRCAGRPERGSCGWRPARSRRPRHSGELADSASSSGRWARSRLSSRIALSGSATPMCTCRAKVGSRRAIPRMVSLHQLVAAGRRDLRVLGIAPGACRPRRSRARSPARRGPAARAAGQARPPPRRPWHGGRWSARAPPRGSRPSSSREVVAEQPPAAGRRAAPASRSRDRGASPPPRDRPCTESTAARPPIRRPPSETSSSGATLPGP